jgi:hypothetical protein
MATAEELHPLDDWVFDEGKLVTFKLFSQVRGVPSAQAQRWARAATRDARFPPCAHADTQGSPARSAHRTLEAFAEKHGTRVAALYLLSGGSGDGGMHTVRLVPKALLEGGRAGERESAAHTRDAAQQGAGARRSSEDAS